MPDPNSTTALWIITLTVIGLVVVFGGVASFTTRRTVKPIDADKSTNPEADAVGAVATYEKARAVAKMAADEKHNQSDQ